MGTRLALRLHLLRLLIAYDVRAVVAGIEHELLELRINLGVGLVDRKGRLLHDPSGIRLDAASLAGLRLVEADGCWLD